MTEPTEGQPTLAEPKKTTRRKPAARRTGSGTRRAKSTPEAELPLEVSTTAAPAAPSAPAAEPIAESAPVPVQAAAPAPAPREAAPVQSAPRPSDVDQIEDAAQILSRITSAPLTAAETVRNEANRSEASRSEGNYTPRPQQQQQRFERHDRRDRRDRGDRNDRNDRGGGNDRGSGDRDDRGERGDFSQENSGEGSQRESDPKQEPIFAEGIVEVSGKGFGFLRDPKRNFVQSPTDVFVTPEVVRRYALRDGHWIKGEVRRGNRGLQMFRLTTINGDDPERYGNFPLFEELTVISPNERFRLETVSDRYTTRVMDLMTPIGKGQRGLIVAPPRTGKTTLLQHIADAVVKNHQETVLIILLVDERPEEVTEIRRTVPTAEIMASSNDMDLKSHTRIAQLAIERSKRLVEAGKDVFILLDSITRVGRAFNNAMGGGGRTMSGGIDARALEIPRKLFAAARNTEEAGSLTIIATALIDTGSRMDELIFQEFKGTGNMEMVLDRKISDLRVYPAIDIFKSGTRREELLVPADQLHKINVIRRGLAGHKPEEAIERLLSFLRKFPTNFQMLKEIPG
jgi:transcription termination factor Rho